MPKVFETTEVVLRKLTPIECERLQGLPDNYTQIPYRGKSKEECPSSKRYEACGRGMSVNVMEFLGTKIKEVNSKDADAVIVRSFPFCETQSNNLGHSIEYICKTSSKHYDPLLKPNNYDKTHSKHLLQQREFN